MSKKKSLYAIVIGSGRFGSRIAGKLSFAGHSVVVIDLDSDHFVNLPPEFTGFMIQGDATDIQTLYSAKIEKADLLLALSDDDNTNFYVAQVAKDLFHTRHVIARVYDPSNLPLFHQFKIDTITPILLAQGMVQKLLDRFQEEIK